MIVLQNDPLLKGKIVTDEFASCGLILGKVPWSREEGKRRWKDEDDAGFYNYMELFYGITGREKLDSALLIVSSQNRINDVKEYLCRLKWDGAKATGYASQRLSGGRGQRIYQSRDAEILVCCRCPCGDWRREV